MTAMMTALARKQ